MNKYFEEYALLKEFITKPQTNRLRQPVKDFPARKCGMSLLLALASFAVSNGALAQIGFPGGGQNTESHIEEPSIDFEISASLEPHNENLLGDSISMEDGSLALHHTDVSLPGNSQLPVAFSRRYAADGTDYFNGILGGWNIDVPFISFRLLTEYVNQHTTPCTGTMLPPATGTGAAVLRDQYWAGMTMFTPGNGGQLMMENVSGGSAVYGSSIPEKTTLDHAKIECLSSVQNGTGEGFLATTSDGFEYRFDFKHSFAAGDLNEYVGTCLGPAFSDCKGAITSNSKPMTRVNLYASRVTDANGNWVDYDYTSNGRLTRIESNDGRLITISYDGNGRIQSVTANGRTWTYSYATSLHDNSAGEFLTELRQVVFPDTRFWQFDLPTMSPQGRELPCWALTAIVDLRDGSIHHPDGAVATLEFQMTPNGKNAVPELPNPVPPGSTPDLHSCNDYQIQKYTTSRAVVSKTLTLAGGEAHIWAYNYHWDLGYFTSLAANDLKQRTVTDPNGDKTLFFYNRRHEDPLEGQLMRTERHASAGSVLEITTNTYQQGPTLGWSSVQTNINPPKRFSNVLATENTARGVDTYNLRNTYNLNLSSSSYSFNQPTKIETWSNLQSGVRETDVVYTHDKGDWILNLPSTVTHNSKLFDSYIYDALGRVTEHKRFGATWKTYGYHGSGTQAGALAWVRDAQNRQTSFNSWKRGKPQSITRPDSVTVSRVVDNNGWVTSVTNARGYATNYTYNNVGWITGIDRPAPFADTAITYDFTTLPVPGAIMRQIMITGTKREVNHYDSFLRVYYNFQNPVDGSFPGIGRRTAYDGLGREIFSSFSDDTYIQPYSVSAPPPGVETTYDALGRVTQTRETVAPYATTKTAYLSDNRVRVTDPMGGQTTTKSSGYGSPDDGNVIQIIDPLNASTSMTYDIYGNITQFAQAGTQNGYTASVTRNFWYNSRLRLCRHATPEMGDELFSYDSLDRMQYSSRGETSGTGCATPSSSLRTAFTYDALDRVTLVNFPSGTADISTIYDANGNKTKVTRGDYVWNYTYNALDLLTREQLVRSDTGSPVTYNFDYAYNTTGFITSQSSPSGKTYSFAPDGLGRPTKASDGIKDYLSNITYHPNGKIASGTFGSGHQFTQTLNGRQLVEQIRTLKSGDDAMDLTHSYNARGQVSAITDYRNTGYNRTFAYDAKGRLIDADGVWGQGSFKYDALDNIRQKKLGARTVNIAYNGDNLVSQVTDTANPTRNFVYDNRGNTTNDGRFGFTYDQANQPTAVTGGGVANSYVYDGNRKRVKHVLASGVIYEFHLRNSGILSMRDNLGAGFKVDFLSVGGMKFRALTNGGGNYFAGDHLGSWSVNIKLTDNNVFYYEHYTPFGELLNPAGPGNLGTHGFTGHVRDKDTGLNYMQARFYDPVVGRFLSTDPIGYQDQFNLYAYVGNDPINNTDPTGEFGVLGAAVGIGAELISIGIDKANGRDVSFGEGVARVAVSGALGAVGAGVATKAIGAIAGAGARAIAKKAAVNATVAGAANGANTAARAGIQVGLTGETEITAGDVAKDVAVGGAAAVAGQALAEGAEFIGKASGLVSQSDDLAAGGTALSRGLTNGVEGAANALGVNAPSAIPNEKVEE